MGKVTELKRINHLVIFCRSGVNRTYVIQTDKQLRRVEQLVGNLLINGDAYASHGSNGQNFRLTISKNIQQA